MDITKILTAVATVCAAIAIVQTYRASRAAHRIAQAQGQLSTPDLQISFLGHPVNNTLSSPHRYALAES